MLTVRNGWEVSYADGAVCLAVRDGKGRRITTKLTRTGLLGLIKALFLHVRTS